MRANHITGKPKAIGIVGTNHPSPHGLEMGYCINIAYWGRGYASEALTGFLKLFWSLEERNDVDSLVGMVDPENGASARVLEKAGARRGELLKGVWKRHGDSEEELRDRRCWIIERPQIEEK